VSELVKYCGARYLKVTVESSIARSDVLAVMWFRIKVYWDGTLCRGRHIAEYLNPRGCRCLVSYKEDTKDLTNERRHREGRKERKCTLERKE
jgi:hypothetical protein